MQAVQGPGPLRQGVAALRIQDSTYGGSDFVMVLSYDLRPLSGGRAPGWEFDVDLVNFWPANSILPTGLP